MQIILVVLLLDFLSRQTPKIKPMMQRFHRRSGIPLWRYPTNWDFVIYYFNDSRMPFKRVNDITHLSETDDLHSKDERSQKKDARIP